MATYKISFGFLHNTIVIADWFDIDSHGFIRFAEAVPGTTRGHVFLRVNSAKVESFTEELDEKGRQELMDIIKRLDAGVESTPQKMIKSTIKAKVKNNYSLTDIPYIHMAKSVGEKYARKNRDE